MAGVVRGDRARDRRDPPPRPTTPATTARTRFLCLGAVVLAGLGTAWVGVEVFQNLSCDGLPAIPVGDDRPGAGDGGPERALPSALDRGGSAREGPGNPDRGGAGDRLGARGGGGGGSPGGRRGDRLGRPVVWNGLAVAAMGYGLPGSWPDTTRNEANGRSGRRSGRGFWSGSCRDGSGGGGRGVAWSSRRVACGAVPVSAMVAPWVGSGPLARGPGGAVPVRGRPDGRGRAARDLGAVGDRGRRPVQSRPRGRRHSGSGRGGRSPSTGPRARTTRRGWPTGRPGSARTSASRGPTRRSSAPISGTGTDLSTDTMISAPTGSSAWPTPRRPTTSSPPGPTGRWPTARVG